MSELPPVRFQQNQGWQAGRNRSVQSPEAALQGDGKVDVLKKSGDWSKFTVGSLGQAFDEGEALPEYYGDPEDEWQEF